MSIEEDISDWGIGKKHWDFLTKFRRENGRNPRVLMIGNIANNAFKNSRALLKFGVECHVLCHDYYHVMACPEWEEAQFTADDLNFNAPDWSSIELGNYERPRWFVQGRLFTALDFLIARRDNTQEAERLWSVLIEERNSGGQICSGSSVAAPADRSAALELANRLASLYAVMFQGGLYLPTALDIEHRYISILLEHVRFQRVFELYDVVIGYATDGLFPLIFGKRPYICFEHGTIRTLPFEENISGQMCALVYACADDVLISNCDNIISARRLNLPSFRFLPHAMIEENLHKVSAQKLRQSMFEKYSIDFIVFHPSRQHWSKNHDLNWEKGNDRLIRGFARFVTEKRPGALLIMVLWGEHVEASRQLIDELGISEKVVWLKPQPMMCVSQYVAAADVLADQFVIGAWGAIMPHGMMLGTPTMLFIDEKLHEWCFPIMPPVLNVRTEEDIFHALQLATNPDYKSLIREKGMAWYDRYHSENVVSGRLIDSLITVLNQTPQKNLLRHLIEFRSELRTQTVLAKAAPTAAGSSVTQNYFTQKILGGSVLTYAKNSFPRLRQKYPVFGGALYKTMYVTYHCLKGLKRLFSGKRG